MIGWRGRIGKICPNVWELGPEYDPILPDGVVIYAFTLGIEKITPEQMEKVFGTYLSAAKMLASQECDVILVAGTPVQTYMGWDRSLDMLRTITETTGIPAISGLKNAFDALKFLSAKKIVLVTPYEEARNKERKKLSENLGFEVVNIRGLGLQRVVDISKLPPYASYRLAKQAFLETPDADAIWISCPVWPTVRNIERLEHDTGKPVVTAVTVNVWAALRAMHINEPIKRYGRLLELL